MSEVPLYRDGPASGENTSHLCRLRILGYVSVQSEGVGQECVCVCVCVCVRVCGRESGVWGRVAPEGGWCARESESERERERERESESERERERERGECMVSRA